MIKKNVLLLLVIILICTFSFHANGQRQPPPPQLPDKMEIERQQSVYLEGIKQRGISNLPGSNTISTPGIIIKTISPKLVKQARNKVKASLTLNENDLLAYRDFMGLPNTGIFKILVHLDCKEIVDKKEKEKCSVESFFIRTRGNSYTFRNKEHTYALRADLILSKNFFRTGMVPIQSIFTDLGDIPISDVTLESDGMEYLVNFKPEKLSVKVQEQFEQLTKGVNVGKYRYVKSLPVKENTTFALRSIAYQTDNSFNKVGKNDDVIIVFRVIRRDAVGNVTILWHELQRQKAIKLKDK